MDIRFKPKFGRQGSTLAVLQGKQVDAGITASAFTTIIIAAPYRKYALLRAGFQMTTVPAGGAGIQLSLVRNSAALAPTSIFYNVPIEIRGLNANQVYPIPFAGNVNTAILPENIYQSVGGDFIGPSAAQSLYVSINALGTVTTQPGGLIITVEVAILE